MGGSYVEDASQSLYGELLIPIAGGAFMRLHMSEVLAVLVLSLVTISHLVSAKSLKNLL